VREPIEGPGDSVEGVIEQEFAGEIEAVVSDVDRMKQEAADAKGQEVMLTLQVKLDEARKEGAAEMLAIIKRRLNIF
jgi:NADPH:quinone reductase-like Zn-dependent oxidoreductase